MESQTETENLIQQVERFALAMKARIAEKAKEGNNGYKNLSLEEIEGIIRDLVNDGNLGNKNDIDLANWCLFYWLKKQN